jgi:hypothetical protein
LKSATLAAGAFPIALTPRRLRREFGDYVHQPLAGAWPRKGVGDSPKIVSILAVDGGATNNNPIMLAHDFLRGSEINSEMPRQTFSRNPSSLDRAIITIAPFPEVRLKPQLSSDIIDVSKVFLSVLSPVRDN